MRTVAHGAGSGNPDNPKPDEPATETWRRVPDWVADSACDAGRHSAIAVYHAVVRHMSDDGRSWPSIATIGERTNLRDRTVRWHLSWLVEIGALIKESRKGQSTVYRIPRQYIAGVDPKPRQSVAGVGSNPGNTLPVPRQYIAGTPAIHCRHNESQEREPRTMMTTRHSSGEDLRRKNIAAKLNIHERDVHPLYEWLERHPDERYRRLAAADRIDELVRVWSWTAPRTGEQHHVRRDAESAVLAPCRRARDERERADRERAAASAEAEAVQRRNGGSRLPSEAVRRRSIQTHAPFLSGDGGADSDGSTTAARPCLRDNRHTS